jgi:hypothetical protein
MSPRDQVEHEMRGAAWIVGAILIGVVALIAIFVL